MYRTKALILSLLFAVLSVPAWAQHTLQLQNVTVKEAVDEIQKRFGYSVIIRSSQVDLARNVSVSATGADIRTILSQIFAGQDVTFSVEDKKIQVSGTVRPAAESRDASSPQPSRHVVKGRILDQGGEPVIGCVIVPDGAAGKAVTADLDGNYSVEVSPDGSLNYDFLFANIREDLSEADLAVVNDDMNAVYPLTMEVLKSLCK